MNLSLYLYRSDLENIKGVRCLLCDDIGGAFGKEGERIGIGIGLQNLVGQVHVPNDLYILRAVSRL